MTTDTTTTSDPIISDMRRELANRGILASDMQPLTTARVTFPGAGWVEVSRWPDEPGWGVDARFSDNGAPHWCNGAGSRVTTVRMLDSDHPVTLELDRLAAELA